MSAVASRLPTTGRRWLVLDGTPPPSVERRSYVERLALAHAEADPENAVVLVREQGKSRAKRLPSRLEVVELDLGPLPDPTTGVNQELERAAALHARLDEVARERPLFDLVLVEGAFGAVVGVPLAQRLDFPLVLALVDCEVSRRRNQLDRGQLYRAELEHWGCDAAAAVVVPRAELVAPLRQYYGCERAIHVAPTPPRHTEPPPPLDLLGRLGLAEPPLLLLAPPQVGADERARLLADHGPAPVLLVAYGVWRADVAGLPPVRLARSPVDGPALATLMTSARAVVVTDPGDPRRDEALALGVAAAWVRPPAQEVARGLR